MGHENLGFPDYSQNVLSSRQCNRFRKIAWPWSSKASSKHRNSSINFQGLAQRSSYNDLSFENNLSHNAEIQDSNARLLFLHSFLYMGDSYISSPFSTSFFILFSLLFSCFLCFETVLDYLKIKFCLRGCTQAQPTCMS